MHLLFEEGLNILGKNEPPPHFCRGDKKKPGQSAHLFGEGVKISQAKVPLLIGEGMKYKSKKAPTLFGEGVKISQAKVPLSLEGALFKGGGGIISQAKISPTLKRGKNIPGKSPLLLERGQRIPGKSVGIMIRG